MLYTNHKLEKMKNYYLYSFYHYLKSKENPLFYKKEDFTKIIHTFEHFQSIAKNFGMIFYKFPNFNEYNVSKSAIDKQIDNICDYLHITEQEIPSLKEVLDYLKNHPFSVPLNKITECALEDLQDCFDIFPYDKDFEALYDSGEMYKDYLEYIKENNLYTEDDLYHISDITDTDLYKELEESKFRTFLYEICMASPMYMDITTGSHPYKDEPVYHNQVDIPYLYIDGPKYFSEKQIVSIEDIIDTYFKYKTELDSEFICYEYDFKSGYISSNPEDNTYTEDTYSEKEAKERLGNIIYTTECIKTLLFDIGEKMQISIQEISQIFQKKEKAYYKEKIENTKEEQKSEIEVDEERCD